MAPSCCSQKAAREAAVSLSRSSSARGGGAASAAAAAAAAASMPRKQGCREVTTASRRRCCAAAGSLLPSASPAIASRSSRPRLPKTGARPSAASRCGALRVTVFVRRRRMVGEHLVPASMTRAACVWQCAMMPEGHAWWCVWVTAATSAARPSALKTPALQTLDLTALPSSALLVPTAGTVPQCPCSATPQRHGGCMHGGGDSAAARAMPLRGHIRLFCRLSFLAFADLRLQPCPEAKTKPRRRGRRARCAQDPADLGGSDGHSVLQA